MTESNIIQLRSACDSLDAILIKEHEKLKGIEDKEHRLLFYKVQESVTNFSHAISKANKSTPHGVLETEYLLLYDELRNYQGWVLNRTIQKKFPSAESEITNIISRCIGVNHDQTHECLESSKDVVEFRNCLKSKATFFVPQ